MAAVLVQRGAQMPHADACGEHAQPVVIVLGQEEILSVVADALVDAAPVEEARDPGAFMTGEQLERLHRRLGGDHGPVLVDQIEIGIDVGNRRIGFEGVRHRVNRCWQVAIVVGGPGQIRSAGGGKARVERGGQSAIRLVPHAADALVARGEIGDDCAGLIGRGVVDDDQLKIAVRLVETALQRLRQIRRAVIRRQDDRDARPVGRLGQATGARRARAGHQLRSVATPTGLTGARSFCCRGRTRSRTAATMRRAAVPSP